MRALLLATPSWLAPGEVKPLKWRVVTGMIWMLLGDAYRDINAIGDYVNSLAIDDLKWTVFRVPFLTNAEAKEVHGGDMESSGLSLSRKSMVQWVMQEMGEERWVGKAPMLWN